VSLCHRMLEDDQVMLGPITFRGAWRGNKPNHKDGWNAGGEADVRVVGGPLGIGAVQHERRNVCDFLASIDVSQGDRLEAHGS
jgi:hypothetical protein